MGAAWGHGGSMPNEMYVGLAAAGPDVVRATFDSVRVELDRPVSPCIGGVMLRSGSIIAGRVMSADSREVRLDRGQNLVIPASQSPRILLRPAGREDGLIHGRAGVLLVSGDFFEATLDRLRDGRAECSSVMFGVRKFEIEHVAAIALADPCLRASAYELVATDGSILKATSVVADGAMLKIAESSGLSLALRLEEVSQINANQ